MAAIDKKLIHFRSLEEFEKRKTAGDILDRSIVFIQDAKLIWTHGQYYGDFSDINDSLEDLQLNKADKSETLSGYNIKDARIENNTIILGENSITIEETTIPTGTSIQLGEDFFESFYPDNTGIGVFDKVNFQDNLDTAITKIEGNVVELLRHTLDNEEVIANAFIELKQEIENTALVPLYYSDTPVLQPEKLGGNKVYKKLISLEYATPGDEATWEIPITSDSSGVIILDMSCILTQTYDTEGTISFDYRDNTMFSENSNQFKYYYKHKSGSIVIKFKSSTTTQITGIVEFSCVNSIDLGNSVSMVDDEIIDGGSSAI